MLKGIMETGDPQGENPEICNTYTNILNNLSEFDVEIEYVDRFGFYEEAKQANAVLATSESALYANMILKKGVIEED